MYQSSGSLKQYVTLTTRNTRYNYLNTESAMFVLNSSPINRNIDIRIARTRSASPKDRRRKIKVDLVWFNRNSVACSYSVPFSNSLLASPGGSCLFFIIARRRQNLSDVRLKTCAVGCVFYIRAFRGACEWMPVEILISSNSPAQLQIEDTINECL